MATFYWVNPADTTEIHGPSGRVGVPGAGQTQRGYLAGVTYTYPDGRSYAAAHTPEWNLYNAQEDATRPADYQEWADPAYLVAFSGVVGDAAASVVETASFTDFNLDQSFTAKTQELSQYTERVSTSAFHHDVGGLEFWAEGDQPTRNIRASYNGYLSNRDADGLTRAVDAGIANGGGTTNGEVAAFWTELRKITLDGNGALYWDRDIKVVLYDRVSLQQVRDAANQNQWSGLAESQGTFDWQWRNANDRVWADMVTAYDDNDVVQLQQIDVAAVSYNWPAFYDGPWAPGRITVFQMRNR